MAGMRIDIDVSSDGVDVSGIVSGALRRITERRGTRLEIRKQADCCGRCARNQDPMKVLSGELHTGYKNGAKCKCRVVEVDDGGNERLVTA